MTAAITAGLDYLYTANAYDPEDKLYAYGLLAKSGYEVTSRARYTLDKEFELKSFKVRLASAQTPELKGKLNELSLAYWAAAQLNDKTRMSLT